MKFKDTLQIVNITNQHNIIIKAPDELNFKVNDLTNHLNQANAKISQCSNEITILNQKIEVFINKINIYTKDNEDLFIQMIMIRGDLDKKYAEFHTIINIKVYLEHRIDQLENEIRKITEVYQKVTLELNQKLIIISYWEKRA